MNKRTGLVALVFGLTSIASATAFADPPCAHGGPPMAAPVVVGQPVYQQPAYAPRTAVAVDRPAFNGYARHHAGGYVQPGYAQPGAVVVAQPTYAQPTYAQPTYAQPTYAQPTYARPAYAPGAAMFVQQLRARLSEVDARLRAGVARGIVAGQALDAFSAQRAQIEEALTRMAGDGALGPREQMRLTRLSERCEQLDEQYRVVAFRGPGRRGWR